MSYIIEIKAETTFVQHQLDLFVEKQSFHLLCPSVWLGLENIRVISETQRKVTGHFNLPGHSIDDVAVSGISSEIPDTAT